MAVEQICVRLVGVDRDAWQKIRGELRPFASDKKDFDGSAIICSAGCRSDCTLRGGYTVQMFSPNSPYGSIASQRKTNVVNYVILLSRDHRIVFAVSLDDDSDNEDSARMIFVATDRRELLSRLSPPPHAKTANTR